jgi:hypothetical protein
MAKIVIDMSGARGKFQTADGTGVVTSASFASPTRIDQIPDLDSPHALRLAQVTRARERRAPA